MTATNAEQEEFCQVTNLDGMMATRFLDFHHDPLITGAMRKATFQRLMQLYPRARRSWYFRALLMDAQGRSAEVIEAADRYLRLGEVRPFPEALLHARERARRRLAESSTEGGPDG